MEKEILTQEMIMQDLKKEYSQNIKGCVIGLVVFIVFALVMGSVIYAMASKDKAPALMIILTVLFCITFLFFVGYIIWQKLLIKNIKLQITTDKLVQITEKGSYPVSYFVHLFCNGNIGHAPYIPYYLYFSEYGKFAIPLQNYIWSETFACTDKGVYYTSKIGDEFYLAISGRKIVRVYNKRLFQLKEN